MSLAVRIQLNLLKVISNIKDEKVRNHVLKVVKKDTQFFKALREISRNTVNGTLPLTNHQKQKLRKYKRQIVKLACSKKNCKDHCKHVTQSGGYLPILIPAVVSILSSILQK